MRTDARHALTHLRVLGADQEATFQTFPEANGATGRPQILHGSLAQRYVELERLNLRAGHGIFVMVNEGDGRGRAARNVIRVRALFLDLDGAQLPSGSVAPIAPHVAVETSAEHYHLYWGVRDVPLERFGKLQAALARAFDGDPKVKDLPRVMRVAGFLHRKREPFLSRVIGANAGEPYALADLLEGLRGFGSSSGRSRPRRRAAPAFRQQP